MTPRRRQGRGGAGPTGTAFEGRARHGPLRPESQYGIWLARVVINDHTEARLMVDTGAALTIVSSDLAARLGLAVDPRGERAELQLLNGRTRGVRVVLDSVRVGDVHLPAVPAVVHDYVDGIDGILGNSFLVHFRVTLDGAEQLLHLRQVGYAPRRGECDE